MPSLYKINILIAYSAALLEGKTEINVRFFKPL